MNEQYVTLVGKVCAPRYEEVYTPEVKSKLPIEASSEGRNLKDYTIYGNNNPNHVDENQSTLPVSIDTYGGNAVDWEIYGNNNPVVENETSTLPIDVSATAGNLLDYTIYGNNDMGKNVIQLGESQTRDGVTITTDIQAGTAILNGDTTTAESGFLVTLFDTSSLVGGDYIFSGGADGGSSTTYDLYLYNRTDQAYMGRLYSSSDAITVTIESGKRYTVYVQCRKGQVYDNIVFKPMLRPANTTSTFEPYTVGVGERTKNLLDITGVDRTTAGVRAVEEEGKLHIYGKSTSNATHVIGIALPDGTLKFTHLEVGQYILSGAVPNDNSNYRLQILWVKDGAVTTTIGYDSGTGLTFDITEPSDVYVRIYVKAAAYDIDVDLIFSPMIRKADTTSDFIPYGCQIPMQAKQRTKNIFEIIPSEQIITETGTLKFTTDAEAGTITANGTSSSEASVKQTFIVTSELAGDYYLSGSFNQTGSLSTFDAYLYDLTAKGFITKWDGTTRSPTIKGTESQEAKLIDGHTIELTIRLFNNTSVDNLVFKPMLRKADTSSDFEPYYNINQTDIYIGNSPLIQGQSITKAQSGQDIALFSGDNIIDTSLYNKPNTSITYNSSVLGVGEWNTPQVYTDWEQGTRVPTAQGGETYSQIKANASNRVRSVNLIPVVTPFYYEINSGYQIGATFFDENGLSLGSSSSVAFRSAPYTYTGVGKYVSFVIKNDANTTITLSSDFEVKIASPYGYQIPLLVTSGQQSTPHTIYIGDSPLTEGQSVSKTSTGTEIALYQGENTISTTLGNKPEMKIDYLSTEVGVGEPTKNLIRAITGSTVLGITFTVDPDAGTVTANGTSTENSQLRIAINNPEDPNNTTVPPGNYYFSGCPSGGSGNSYNCYSWDTDTGARSKRWDGTTNVETDVGQGNCQVQINGHRQSILLRIAKGYTANNLIFKPMLRLADTTPDFEPYGYQIPIDIKQDDEVVDHKDIYVGTQPLEEGASVSKASVGEDIILVSGKNYIDTDLFNKPEMYIK